jgi:GH24 family phage-related lysozyme (muramidase)
VLPYIEQSVAKLKQFEGCIPWMYRDTVGKVTVGVGLMLPDAAAACALPFLSAETGQDPATPQQIAGDYARVNALAPGKLPGFYKAATSPQLPQATIDAKLLSVLENFEAVLRANISTYDTLPDGARLALLDMAYNLGPEGLLHGYPRMIHSIEIGAWADATAQCERHGPGDARNAWTRQQLLSNVARTIQAAIATESEILEETAAALLSRVIRKRHSTSRRK